MTSFFFSNYHKLLEVLVYSNTSRVERDKVLKGTSRTADFWQLNRKMPAPPFSVVMLYTGSCPQPRSPAYSMEVVLLLLGEKPETRTVNLISQFTSAEFNQESIQSHMLYYFKHIQQRCWNQGYFLFLPHKIHSSRKKRIAGLQINCSQYEQTEIQFRSAWLRTAEYLLLLGI